MLIESDSTETVTAAGGGVLEGEEQMNKPETAESLEAGDEGHSFQKSVGSGS